MINTAIIIILALLEISVLNHVPILFIIANGLNMKHAPPDSVVFFKLSGYSTQFEVAHRDNAKKMGFYFWKKIIYPLLCIPGEYKGIMSMAGT